MSSEERGRTPVMNEKHESGSPATIGFDDEILDEGPKRTFSSSSGADVVRELIAERHAILADSKLKAKERLRLLESNRQTIVVVSGGTIKKTENVVYSILVFGAVVIVILALLTVFGGLPPEVTLTFVGTVLGGTIATIAQKLGKL